MPEETQVVSSPTEVEDVFKGEAPTMAEYTKFREDGTLPERLKPAESAESATDDALEETEESEEETPEPELDSDPDETQGLKPKTAKRIAQLLAEQKELKRQLAEKQDVKPESSTAKAELQYTRPKPTPEGNGPDGKPYETYEDFIDDRSKWVTEQTLAADKREQEQQSAMKALNAKLDEARTRYADADAVIFPASKAVQEARIPNAVKEVFAGSDVFVDLCYVVGSDSEALEKFITLAKTNPRAAIGQVFEFERGIREELEQKRDDKGKFVAPEKKTAAPKPPQPVNGASSRAFDVSDESLSADEWFRKRNAQLQQKT